MKKLHNQSDVISVTIMSACQTFRNRFNFITNCSVVYVYSIYTWTVFVRKSRQILWISASILHSAQSLSFAWIPVPAVILRDTWHCNWWSTVRMDCSVQLYNNFTTTGQCVRNMQVHTNTRCTSKRIIIGGRGTIRNEWRHHTHCHVTHTARNTVRIFCELWTVSEKTPVVISDAWWTLDL